MKIIVAIIFAFGLSVSYSFAQKYQVGVFGGTFWDNGLESFMEVRNRFSMTRSYYNTNFGIEFKRKFSSKLSLVTAYDFTYSYLQVGLVAGQPPAMYTGTKIYTHSIPFLLDYKLPFRKSTDKNLSLRAGFGAEFFKPQWTEFGSVSIENIYVATFKYALYYTLYTPKNPIPFVQANIGYEDKLGDNSTLRFAFGYKLLLSDFNHEIFNYYNNYSSPAVITIATETTKISYYTLNICYLFNVKSKR